MSGPAALPAPARPPGFRGVWRADDAARAVYGEAAGIARAWPRAVAVPADADDVRALAAWAAATGTPLVPRGAGSSMAGGAVGDGVSVDLSRLAALGTVDAAARRLACGPGLTGAAADAAARAAGLRFPVDPSSWTWATVGGMAATNAAGAHTLRHGAMRPWVAALDCVFADGTRAWVRRGEAPPDVPAVRRFLADAAPRVRAAAAAGAALAHGTRKESSGYALAEYARSGALVDLLVGSEGTLALFVGVELALAPAPGATASVLGAFASLEEAALGAEGARAAGAAACELLDRTFLDVAAEGGALPDAVRAEGGAVPEAVLLCEVEAGDAAAAGGAARALGDALRAAGARHVALALDPAAEHALWELRHAASPILARLDPALASMQFVEDGCVPPGRLPDYVRGVRAALARRGVRGVIFGHAGDAHVHVNPLVDVRRPDWRAAVEGLLDDVAGLTAALGGTLAGEHGDGRLRTPLLGRVWGAEALALFAAVKRAFDPAGVLNPGVKVPLPGQRPLGDIKYDPALPPAPPAARAALDRVAQRRAYGAFRLDLLAEAEAGAEARGAPEQVALPQVAPEPTERVALRLRLHPLGHGLQAQRARELHHGAHQRLRVRVGRRAVQPVHEALVDLEHAQRVAVQVGQRRVPRAEVVERGAHAHRGERRERVEHAPGVAHGHALGELDGEAARLRAALGQRLPHRRAHRAAVQRPARDVDRHA